MTRAGDSSTIGRNPRTVAPMKDQISADLLATGAKVAPPALVAAATAAGGISPQSILVWLTILYTLSLLLTNVVRNWGTWMDWWSDRAKDLRRLWAWVRRRG